MTDFIAGAICLKPKDFITADLTVKDSSLNGERKLECISIEIQDFAPEGIEPFIRAFHDKGELDFTVTLKK